MLKIWNIFVNLAKSKKYFFANIYQSQFESHEVLKLECRYYFIQISHFYYLVRSGISPSYFQSYGASTGILLDKKDLFLLSLSNFVYKIIFNPDILVLVRNLLQEGRNDMDLQLAAKSNLELFCGLDLEQKLLKGQRRWKRENGQESDE
jgi:hypothetical protein